MARDGSVLVKFLADTLGFRRGTDDMARALDDAARTTERDTEHMSRAFRDAGQKIHRTTQDVGDGTKMTMKDAGKEAGAEFVQNMGEGIGSGQANLMDTVLGTVGGIAPALGAAGVGVAVGATAALGIINGIKAQNEKVRQAAADLFDAMRRASSTRPRRRTCSSKPWAWTTCTTPWGRPRRKPRSSACPSRTSSSTWRQRDV